MEGMRRKQRRVNGNFNVMKRQRGKVPEQRYMQLVLPRKHRQKVMEVAHSMPGEDVLISSGCTWSHMFFCSKPSIVECNIL